MVPQQPHDRRPPLPAVRKSGRAAAVGQNEVARCLIEVYSVPATAAVRLVAHLPLGMAFTVMDTSPSVEVLWDVSE